MSQEAEVHELPGDIPRPAELPGDFPRPSELAGDEPSSIETPSLTTDNLLPTPFSGFSGRSSHPSLRPRPLNFSRPRPHGADSYGFRGESDAGSVPSEHLEAEEKLTDGTGGKERSDVIDNDDDLAAPPPVIKTYANLKGMNLSRDDIDGASIDEALPPAIKTTKAAYENHAGLNMSAQESTLRDSPVSPRFTDFYRKDSQVLPTIGNHHTAVPALFQNNGHLLSRKDTQSSVTSSFDESLPPPVSLSRYTLSHQDTDNSKSTKSSGDTKVSRGDSAVETPIPIPPKSEARKRSLAEPQAPRVCIYKPYIDYASSQRSSSVATNTTYDSNTSTGEPEVNEDKRHNATNGDADSTRNSSITDFAFDGQLGWNPREDKETRNQQRWTAPNPLRLITSRSKGKERQEDPESPSATHQQQRQDSTTSSTSASSTSTLSPVTSPASVLRKPPPIQPRIPRIIKRTSIDQMSEHVNPWQGETMSDRGSESSNEWTSSEVDTSGLSVEKIHKLKKKGINPALYVEMKSARRGKSRWVSPLQGNSFIS